MSCDVWNTASFPPAVPYPVEFGAQGCSCPDGVDGVDEHYSDCIYANDLTRARNRMHDFAVLDSLGGFPILRCANKCATIYYPWRTEPRSQCKPLTRKAT